MESTTDIEANMTHTTTTLSELGEATAQRAYWDIRWRRLVLEACETSSMRVVAEAAGITAGRVAQIVAEDRELNGPCYKVIDPDHVVSVARGADRLARATCSCGWRSSGCSTWKLAERYAQEHGGA